MVVIRYDAGGEEPVEIEPADGDVEYIAEHGIWSIKDGEEGDRDCITWIPQERVYEVRGFRTRLRSEL